MTVLYASPSDDETVAMVGESGLAELQKLHRPGPGAFEARAGVDDKPPRLVAVDAVDRMKAIGGNLHFKEQGIVLGR